MPTRASRFHPPAFHPRVSLDLRAPHDLVAGANAADEPPALLTSDEEQPKNSVLIDDVSHRGEQGGADSSTHRRSEKPDEIAQWRYVTEVCAPHAYSVLMHVSQGKPDFVAPLAPRNLAIFDDAFDDYGALSTRCTKMTCSSRCRSRQASSRIMSRRSPPGARTSASRVSAPVHPLVALPS